MRREIPLALLMVLIIGLFIPWISLKAGLIASVEYTGFSLLRMGLTRFVEHMHSVVIGYPITEEAQEKMFTISLYTLSILLYIAGTLALAIEIYLKRVSWIPGAVLLGSWVVWMIFIEVFKTQLKEGIGDGEDVGYVVDMMVTSGAGPYIPLVVGSILLYLWHISREGKAGENGIDTEVNTADENDWDVLSNSYSLSPCLYGHGGIRSISQVSLMPWYMHC